MKVVRDGGEDFILKGNVSTENEIRDNDWFFFEVVYSPSCTHFPLTYQ